MSDAIVYAKQVNEEPSDNIPVAKQPEVIIGEYIETSDVQNQIINLDFVNMCWGYGAGVRIITGLDIIFGIINSFFYNPFLLFTCIVPLCGYQGATQFSTIKTMIYLIYSYIYTFSRFLQVFEVDQYYNINNINNTNITDNSVYTLTNTDIKYNVSVPMYILSILGICQLFISVYISKFLCNLYKLNKDELYILRGRIKEQNINEYFCC